MFDSSPNRLVSLAKIAIPLVLIVWFAGYVGFAPSNYNQLLNRLQADEHKTFVEQVIAQDIDGVVDSSALRALCDNQTWTPELVLSCDASAGGIGEVRNAQLHCLRLAIELGAALVVPQIAKRSDSDLTRLIPAGKGPTRGLPFDYMFDYDHFSHVLAAHCPQMTVYRSMDDLANIPSVLEARKVEAEDIGLPKNSAIPDAAAFSRALRKYVDMHKPDNRTKYPLYRFNLPSITYAWPVAADAPALARTFGQIIRVRPDIRRLAASALFTLHERRGVSVSLPDPITPPPPTVDNNSPTSPNDAPVAVEHDDGFVGIHLRTEDDAVAANFATYEQQAAYYLDFVEQSGAPVVFVASGLPDHELDRFRLRAADFNATTVTKTDLLSTEAQRSALRQLTWDQRALIDYEILLRARAMAGMARSAFSWSVALRRHQAYQRFDTEEERAAWEAAETARATAKDVGTVVWTDDFSTLYGRWEGWQRMRDTIWP